MVLTKTCYFSIHWLFILLYTLHFVIRFLNQTSHRTSHRLRQKNDHVLMFSELVFTKKEEEKSYCSKYSWQTNSLPLSLFTSLILRDTLCKFMYMIIATVVVNFKILILDFWLLVFCCCCVCVCLFCLLVCSLVFCRFLLKCLFCSLTDT